jgi:hypothetical protein
VTKKKDAGPIIRAVVERFDAQGQRVMQNGRPNPTGPGRYCMPPPGTCYCGGCAHWRPLVPIDYSRIEGATANAQHAQSWANREGGTWIDDL